MIEIKHSGLNQYGVDEIQNYYNGKHSFKIGYGLALPTTKQFKDIKHYNKLGLENKGYPILCFNAEKMSC